MDEARLGVESTTRPTRRPRFSKVAKNSSGYSALQVSPTSDHFLVLQVHPGRRTVVDPNQVLHVATQGHGRDALGLFGRGGRSWARCMPCSAAGFGRRRFIERDWLVREGVSPLAGAEAALLRRRFVRRAFVLFGLDFPGFGRSRPPDIRTTAPRPTPTWPPPRGSSTGEAIP